MITVDPRDARGYVDGFVLEVHTDRGRGQIELDRDEMRALLCLLPLEELVLAGASAPRMMLREPEKRRQGAICACGAHGGMHVADDACVKEENQTQENPSTLQPERDHMRECARTFSPSLACGWRGLASICTLSQSRQYLCPECGCHTNPMLEPAKDHIQRCTNCEWGTLITLCAGTHPDERLCPQCGGATTLEEA